MATQWNMFTSSPKGPEHMALLITLFHKILTFLWHSFLRNTFLSSHFTFSLYTPFILLSGSSCVCDLQTLCDPVGCSLPGSSVHGLLQAAIMEWVDVSSSGDLPDPGIEPASPAAPALQVDSLPLSHWAKPPFILFASKCWYFICLCSQHCFSSFFFKWNYPNMWLKLSLICLCFSILNPQLDLSPELRCI